VIYTEAGNNPPPLGEGRVGASVTVIGVPVSDTCKEVVDGLVRATVPRESLMVARGPWVFTRDALADTLQRVAGRDAGIRDMTGLCEAARVRVRVLPMQ
jgi:2-C-methyl-D-erythritol 4-phosphate cytidylyltransferase